jgi:hypothetical protein
MSDHPSLVPMTGDIITVEGIYRRIPNPARRSWQFWKPRLVDSDELQIFKVQK